MWGLCFTAALLGQGKVPQERVEVPLDSKKCGALCARLLLEHAKKDFSQAALDRELRPDEKGVSLAKLQRVLHEHGLPMEIVRVGSEQAIATLPRPAVVHLGARADDGHFMILCGDSSTSMRLIDGTTGRVVEWGRGDFFRNFSGYALVPKTNHFTRTIAALALACVGVGFLIHLGVQAAKRNSQVPAFLNAGGLSNG